MSDRTQAVRQRQNILNIIRELEADRARILKHEEVLRRLVDEIEREYGLGKQGYAPAVRASEPIA